MKITVTREHLHEAMQTLQAIAAVKNALPILSHVRVKADDRGIEFAANNLEVALRRTVEGTVEETGVITIPARKLGDLARELPDEPIHIQTTGSQVLIECGRTSYRMFGLPADEFPTMSAIGDSGFTIEAPLLRRMIQRTRFAASTEEGRYFLNGVYFHLSPEWVRMVATDSRRLAMVHIPAEGLSDSEKGVIIPLKAVEEILRTFTGEEDVRIEIQDNEILFGNEESTLSSRLMEGEYPAYAQIIPRDNPIRLEADREAFLTAIRRVSLFSDPKTLSVRLEIKETSFVVSAGTPDFGEAREELDGACTEPLEIGFNAKYLMDALTAMDSDMIRMDFKEPLSAAVLRPVDSEEDYLCLIMPMRIES